MIIKSYEIEKKNSFLFKHNIFLLYGIKKDIKKIIETNIKKNNKKIENLSLYENEIIDNEESFYNTIYSGSLFSDKKIITIQNGTDKIINNIEYILNKKPDNIFLFIFSDILEKKSKLRNLFEKQTNAICIPCYLDNERDLENIAKKEFAKINLPLSRETLNLLIEKSNQDRDNLRNEIEKITLFAHNKKNLETNEIKNIINFSGEYKSDNFINECLGGNILKFKKIISEFYLSTVNQILLLRILSNKMQRLVKMKEQENNVWRRVVSSPVPLYIFNGKSVKHLVEFGTIVIAGGGGGIPAFDDENNILHGLDAVIDKDMSAALLGRVIRAEELFIITDVDQVYINYGSDNQSKILQTNIEELKKWIEEGQFGEGTMLPKIYAAIYFLEHHGQKVIISSFKKIKEAISGTAGTIITKGK